MARFHREAQVVASLNHTNIARVYGLEDADGTKALVMELVEGPTLADHVAEGAIPIDEALLIATQVADALEAADEHGPPEGGRYAHDGRSVRLQPDLSLSPTITTPAMTQVGVILGTAAYLSPEQVKGRLADKRSDIWSFGCVLYEMLTRVLKRLAPTK